MAIRYPNGKKYQPNTPTASNAQKKTVSYGKRGMSLEQDLNDTNAYYLTHGLAVIHKKPTPVQIVGVDYPKRSSAKIKEAYFKTPSTTDYNGVYQGKYIDFEAKETKNTSSFPLSNFHQHQLTHMEGVQKQDGIVFVIIAFQTLGEVYLIPFEHFQPFWQRMLDGGRKSVTLQELKDVADQIPYGLNPRLDYLSIIRKHYF
ncbi:Holliday junction resolvase RecU [Listeria newyorkensis]|uniref:Holliday junction resolvase RecU n=1 Tax=Listeria newyorkensis TaxID=1497681 RepID=A0A841YVT9_9LIST|nr:MULTISPECIES: Holliday junction resolvase RecU [Listeria]KGL44866.1 Holliday junction resolvase [Listeriaceae bacterium FSL A5-0209]KGL41009.1 Holliday junction resolvase [Listeria newyorkensis]KMT57811.1 Holliday junction-specific endonuclease [Listeria newyorkensis]MBC1457425.1 Holliday junction resolvase RecU [Listeria newyorkensis]PNP92486.1 Holliday junction resolvase RecU [Listeria newyorkensis]